MTVVEKSGNLAHRVPVKGKAECLARLSPHGPTIYPRYFNKLQRRIVETSKFVRSLGLGSSSIERVGRVFSRR
jgi:hypothetical protein